MDQRHLQDPGARLEHETRVTAYAMRVFDRYNEIMARTYGTAWPRRQYHDNTQQWKACRDIAELCIDRDWDVELFVTETMKLMRHNHTLLHPRKLLHPKVVAKYMEDHVKGVLPSTPENTWTYLVSTVRARAEGVDVNGLMFSPFTSYPAWFRIVYPETVEERTYELYAEDARVQLAEQRELRAFIRKTVPGRLEALEQRWGFFGDGKEL